jgi:hypothetical protein
MGEWLAKTPLGSAAKTFIAFVIAAAVADWVSGGDISLGNWETWVIGGLASCIPPVINWLNPSFDSYGRGSDGR